ncbi:MAG: cell division protein FtsA [Chloroflexota bacterium]|nr:cell division protein FtsA [Chloroflexota bacterium]
MERTIVGIDVGSSKVCTLVGEVNDEGAVRVVGVGLVPGRGVRRGVVVNVVDATASIVASIEKAERTSGYKIERAYVGLSGTHVSSLNSRGVVGISRREHGITVEDVDRALDAAHAIAVSHNQEVVHVIPRGYSVDGQSGVRDPIGMHGFRLEVEAHIVIGSSTSIQNLVKCVEGAGVEVDELVLASVAAGDAVLTDTEREMGVVLADIGAGVIDLAIFIDGTVWHTVTVGLGGEHITGDVAIGLRLPPDVAEQVKIEHGHACASQVLPEERFTVSAFNGDVRQAVLRWRLAEIIEARAEELLLMIQQEIKRSGYDGLLPAGVVLCGGTAQLSGIQELGRDVLGLPVRVGSPQQIHGLVDKVANPAQAVGAGLMGWGLTVDTRPQLRRLDPGVGQRLLNWLRVFLPS